MTTKNEVVRVRFNPADKAELLAAVAGANQTLSGWVRYNLREASRNEALNEKD